MSQARDRDVISDGQNATEALTVLRADVPSTDTIRDRAASVVARSVNPIAAESERSDGLIYGLIQSGKTSVMTVAAAMAADNGFQAIIILTSDIDLLYDQTLERIRKALRGMTVLGKNDWKDSTRFNRQLRTPPFAVVCSKNSSKLNSLLEAFKKGRSGGLSLLLIDDEADQASLNTKTSAGTGAVSPINRVITALRNYFPRNTYLQVTATPQALFLQKPDHQYRPNFTVLTNPGPGYVGGDEFFDGDALLRYVDLAEVTQLTASNQPAPRGTLPTGLRKALCTFLVAATAKLIAQPDREGFAFLCHVSVNTKDHEYIVALIDNFKQDLTVDLKDDTTSKYRSVLNELLDAYDDLAKTEKTLPAFDDIVRKIKFYVRGANVKLINATSSDEIKLDGAFNLFVGGNKLGRGVTIKNLLVSYYGRNPKRPNADTVLQHARMYGYRQRDVGVTRLFLPRVLADHFRAIHQMEKALRRLIEQKPEGEFLGIYVQNSMKATRSNILDPTSIGMYVAGQSYNPSYPLRNGVGNNTEWLDREMENFRDEERYYGIAIERIPALLAKCQTDPSYPNTLWDTKSFEAALGGLKTILQIDTANLVVIRDRNLNEPRRETQGILSGGEIDLAPRDKPTLFLLRQNANRKGEEAVWWPQLRFPDGNYAIAFNIKA